MQVAALGKETSASLEARRLYPHVRKSELRTMVQCDETG